MCGRHYFGQRPFLTHLMQEHNYRQYLTEKLHHFLLTLIPAKTCPYCGSISHAHSVGRRCIVIFNLATALCTGGHDRRDGRIEYGSGRFHLEERSQSSSASATGYLWKRQQRKSKARTHGQATQGRQDQDRQTPTNADSAQRFPAGAVTTHGQDDPETGGHVELHADRTSVSGSCQRWQWQHPSGAHSGHTGMESRQQPHQRSSEAPTCPDNDDNSAGPNAKFESIAGQRRCGEGVLASSHSGPEHGDAVPAMESKGSAIGAHHGQTSEGGRSPETLGRSDQVDGRQCHDGEVPLVETDGRHANAGDSVVMDGVIKDKPGAVASSQISDFSLMLAACSMQGEVPQHAAIKSGSTAEQDALKPRLVRLLLNPSHTLCYANAALQCLAWMSILYSSVTAAAWTKGYGLIDALTSWTPVPLVLYHFAPFQELFNGGDWGLREKDRQNDLNDFTSHILLLLAPQFVNNSWVSQPALLPDFEGTRLQDEKGHALQPILLTLYDTTLDCCKLSDMIHTWHDPSGLCRSFVEAPTVCRFAIDRNLPPHNIKCQQCVDLQDGILQLPYFNGEHQISWKPYRIAAVAFHIGRNSSSGHWRAALFHQNRWFVYDDGCLPEQMTRLSLTIQKQVNQIWLIDCALDRTPLAATAAASVHLGRSAV